MDIIDGAFGVIDNIRRRHIDDLNMIASGMRELIAANASIGKK